MSTEPVILVEKSDDVCLITLNRPKQANSFLRSMYRQLADIISSVGKDPEVKVCVLTGGGKFFSTGADVRETSEQMLGNSDPGKAMAAAARAGPVTLTQALIDFPKFMVAAVNGPAVGYSAAFLGLFDAVYVAESASMFIPLMHLGICPEGGSSYTLPRAFGPSLFTDLFLNGRTLSSSEMVSSGLAASVFPDENFLAAVLKRLTKGAAASPMGSILATKALMKASRQELNDTNKLEADAVAKRFESGDPLRRFSQKAKQIGSKGKRSKL